MKLIHIMKTVLQIAVPETLLPNGKASDDWLAYDLVTVP